MSNFLWARLKPINRKAGFLIGQLHFKDVLYRGGDKPDWYKVDAALAAVLGKLKQEDTNPRSEDAFDIVSDDERKRIDGIENSRRMVALGLVSASFSESVTVPARQVDLTTPEAPTVPEAPAVIVPPAPAAREVAPGLLEDDGRAAAVPPPPAGALTTDDLPRGGRRGRSSR